MKRFLAVVFAAALSPAVVRATPISFTIDPAQSSLTASGSMAGTVMMAQKFGSNVTSYSGTVEADLTAEGIKFTGGSLVAANQSGMLEPDIDGMLGSARANYGHWASVELGLFQTLEGNSAIRGLVFSPSSQIVPMSLSGDAHSFDTTQLDFTVASGTIDYLIGSSYFGSRDLSALYDTNGDGPATLAVTGNVETLTIPVSLGFRTSMMTANDSILMFSGQIVATREVPEPAGLGLLCLSAVGLLRRRR